MATFHRCHEVAGRFVLYCTVLYCEDYDDNIQILREYLLYLKIFLLNQYITMRCDEDCMFSQYKAANDFYRQKQKKCNLSMKRNQMCMPKEISTLKKNTSYRASNFDVSDELGDAITGYTWRNLIKEQEEGSE